MAILILLINLFKYPFFRFGSQYTAQSGKNLVEGYAEKGKVYLIIYFLLNIFSAVVNTAGVAMICAAIVSNFFPNALGLTPSQWTAIIIIIVWGMLLLGEYRFLDGFSKWIMISLTFATVGAVVVALFQHREYAPDFVVTTPWKMAALPF